MIYLVQEKEPMENQNEKPPLNAGPRWFASTRRGNSDGMGDPRPEGSPSRTFNGMAPAQSWRGCFFTVLAGSNDVGRTKLEQPDSKRKEACPAQQTRTRQRVSDQSREGVRRLEEKVEEYEMMRQAAKLAEKADCDPMLVIKPLKIQY